MLHPGTRGGKEVLIGHLQVVLYCDELGVSNPCGDNVQRKFVGQFGLTRAAKILKQLWLRLQPRSFDDLAKSRANILRRVAVTHDTVRDASLCEALRSMA